MPSLHSAVPLLQEYLTHAARRHRDKVALVSAERRSTYQDIDSWSNAVAHTLCASGVTRGDRVMIFGDNGEEVAVSFWAALKASAIPCLVNPLTKPEKLCYILDDCTPAAFIGDQKLNDAFESSLASRASIRSVIVFGSARRAGLASSAYNPKTWETALSEGDPIKAPSIENIESDLAAIIYTSGSTGHPKGVMLTHRNMLTACTSISAYLDVRTKDVILCFLPLSFDYGLYQMLMAFRAGARLILERSFAFPTQVLKRMSEEKVTGFPGTPTVFAILGELKGSLPYDFSHVRYVTSTTSALPQKHIRIIGNMFPKAQIFSMYGLTECKRCTYLPPADLERKRGSVGIAIPNTEIWVVDNNGHRVGPGVEGQLVVRGATVMQGYWGKPEESAERLRPGPLLGERVLFTGDICKMDEEGYLYFVRRMDDVIKCRGEKVSPKEVEDVLLAISGVKEAAVIGVPDEILGEAVKAYVVLESGATVAERSLRLECQKRLEPYMVPKHITIVPSLPRTDTWKIRKRDLS